MLKMKKMNWKISMMLMAMTVGLLYSCNEEEPVLAPPFSKVAGLHGTWVVSSVVQVDEQTVLKDEIDLTNYFVTGSNLLALEFDSTDFTYVVQEGAGNNPFGSGGTWAFDDMDYPSEIYLYSAEDTLTVALGETIREFDNNLTLSWERFCGDAETGTHILTYKYLFNRE